MSDGFQAAEPGGTPGAPTSPQVTTIRLNPDELDTESGTQPRVALDPAVVEAYAEHLAVDPNLDLPAVDAVVDDSGTYWLWDGFHRVAAYRMAKREHILVRVTNGAQRDAVLLSLGANATHGQPRTHADKLHVLGIILKDPEWSRWATHEIHKRTGLTRRFIEEHRNGLTSARAPVADRKRTYKTKHGTTSTMDTSRIGCTPDPNLFDEPVQPTPAEAAQPQPTAPWAEEGNRKDVVEPGSTGTREPKPPGRNQSHARNPVQKGASWTDQWKRFGPKANQVVKTLQRLAERKTKPSRQAVGKVIADFRGFIDDLERELGGHREP
jgi:hypothetical protein